MIGLFVISLAIVFSAIFLIGWAQVYKRLGFKAALVVCVGLAGFSLYWQSEVERMFAPCNTDQSASAIAKRMITFSSVCGLPAEYERPAHLRDPMQIGIRNARNGFLFYLSVCVGFLSACRFAISRLSAQG